MEENHIKHYEGRLGKFDYDDREFEVTTNYGCYALHYIGNETDGRKIHIPEGIKDCYSMFCNCTSLTQAPKIPEGVKWCWYMFQNCTSLTQAPDIPEGAKDCYHMFENCTSLTQAPEIPNGVTDCNDMFSGCTSLTQAAKIPEGVEDCSFMFRDCASLIQAPEIPEGVTDCYCMFQNCTSLTQAPEIPKGVKDCRYMFYNCTSLTQAPEIPTSVTFCEGIFYNCIKLNKGLSEKQLADAVVSEFKLNRTGEPRPVKNLVIAIDAVSNILKISDEIILDALENTYSLNPKKLNSIEPETTLEELEHMTPTLEITAEQSHDDVPDAGDDDDEPDLED